MLTLVEEGKQRSHEAIQSVRVILKEISLFPREHVWRKTTAHGKQNKNLVYIISPKEIYHFIL